MAVTWRLHGHLQALELGVGDMHVAHDQRAVDGEHGEVSGVPTIHLLRPQGDQVAVGAWQPLDGREASRRVPLPRCPRDADAVEGGRGGEEQVGPSVLVGVGLVLRAARVGQALLWPSRGGHTAVTRRLHGVGQALLAWHHQPPLASVVPDDSLVPEIPRARRAGRGPHGLVLRRPVDVAQRPPGLHHLEPLRTQSGASAVSLASRQHVPPCPVPTKPLPTRLWARRAVDMGLGRGEVDSGRCNGM